MEPWSSGELAIWSERHVGVLIQEAKQKGVVRHGGDKKEKQADSVSACSLTEFLGTESDTEAQQISSRSQKLADHEPDVARGPGQGSRVLHF